jgi:arginine deiminase
LGIDSEWGRLRSVIVRRPGAELDVSLSDPDALHEMEVETRDAGL